MLFTFLCFAYGVLVNLILFFPCFQIAPLPTPFPWRLATPPLPQYLWQTARWDGQPGCTHPVRTLLRDLRTGVG